MSSPVPAFLPWATAPAFVPVATAMPVPLAKAVPVEYPSVYLPDYAVTVTCPSWICNPIGATPDKTTSTPADSSANLFSDALNSINEIVFRKESDIVIEKPTPTLKPATLTVSAPDAYTHYLFVPDSYPLWFPWVEGPVLKWGVIYPVLKIGNKAWWALEVSGIFDLTFKYCPSTHEIVPYIWHKGLPFLSDFWKLLVRLIGFALLYVLKACVDIAVGVAISLKKDVVPWVLERVAHYIEYVISLMIALTFRDYVQILTVIDLFLLRKHFMANDSMTGRTMAYFQHHLMGLRGAFSAHRRQVVAQRAALVARIGIHTRYMAMLRRDTNDLANAFFAVKNQVNEDLEVLDKRSDLHRKDILTLQRNTETRFKAVEERLDNVETAVEGHDADIRVMRGNIEDLKDRVKKQRKETIACFRVVEAVLEAADADIRVIHNDITDDKEQISKSQQHIDNVESLVEDAAKLIEQQLGAVNQNIRNIDQTVADVLKTVTKAQKQVTGVKDKIRPIEESLDSFREWCIGANNKFETISSTTAVIKTAIAAVRSTATLLKDHLIQLFDKVLPQFSQDVMHAYAHLDTQPGSPIEIEVVLNERLQNTLVRMISEKLTSEVTQSGAVEEQITALRKQLADLQKLLAQKSEEAGAVQQQLTALQEQITSLMMFGRIGADVHNSLAEAHNALEDRVQSLVRETSTATVQDLEQDEDLEPAPLRIKKKPPVDDSF
ncbi:hypothetical protein P171DRAFT_448228 [Karstenula rhodostoma CBS 690.94]|uniref:Uncharacterized protein n=1 Tax=Karstenula rhodostoma CBS 690.94 TaxID=1392251 RepID=A0A9P4P9N9_9PLEO|nr:hypothetical protein P171DRAFT_448228 [Karstenula rhodostoma CBS 690.94]